MGEAAQRVVRACALAGACAALWAQPAGAHHPAAALAAAPASCAGAADSSLQPQRVITGEFDTSLEGAYVMLPFVVPAGTTAVRVRYCHDQPEAPTNAQHQARARPRAVAKRARRPARRGHEPEFRGWGGSSHPGRDGVAQRLLERGAVPREPQAPPPGTHDARLPCPGRSRRASGRSSWASRRSRRRRRATPTARSRGGSRSTLSTDPLWESGPYAPAPYDETPARPAGRLVRGRLPRPRRALFARRRDHARDVRLRVRSGRDCGGCTAGRRTRLHHALRLRDAARRGARSGATSPTHPGKLIVRSSEVITYRGHTNNHASLTLRRLPHRSGVRATRRRHAGAAAAPHDRRARIFDAVHAAGGFTQINHPTIFPSEVPGFDFICRGCPWDYSDAEHRLLARWTRSRSRPGRRGSRRTRSPGRTRSPRSRSSSGRTRSTPAG